MSNTLGSMTDTAGIKATAAIGDMYNNRFIEFNFSLKGVMKAHVMEPRLGWIKDKMI